MVTRFQTVDRATPYILPQSIEDWLPEDHLARFVVEVVSKLDLAPLRASYAGRGSTPYDPGMLLSLLFYGYATGVRSSRKIEAGTHDSVAFRYIAANSHPDHDTIASFRLRFLVEIGEQPRNRDETAGKNQPDRKGVDSMSVFLRVTDIFKANVNDMLDRMEDPEKMVKQMIIEMEEALVKATSGLAKAMANEQNLRKQQTLAMTQAKQWEDKAAMALRAGNADLAKQALSKKMIYDGQAKQYDAMVAQASSTTSQLRGQLDSLKTKLDEARMKQATLVARAQAAKTQKEFSTVLGTNVGQGAFAKFDKMEKKIEGMEAEAQAFSELSGEAAADDPFRDMEKDMQLEAEMAKLMEKMNAGGGAGA